MACHGIGHCPCRHGLDHGISWHMPWHMPSRGMPCQMPWSRPCRNMRFMPILVFLFFLSFLWPSFTRLKQLLSRLDETLRITYCRELPRYILTYTYIYIYILIYTCMHICIPICIHTQALLLRKNTPISVAVKMAAHLSHVSRSC